MRTAVKTTTAAYTVGDLARMFDCPEWAVRRLFTRGLIREPARLGPYRLIPNEQVGAVEQALRAAGYIRAAELSVE